MHSRSLLLSSLLLVTPACLCPPGQTRVGDVCQDACESDADCAAGQTCEPGGCVGGSSSSSSGGSSSSSGGTTDAGVLPLEALCPSLAATNMRMNTILALTSMVHECAPAFADEREALQALAGPEYTPERACSPDGGWVWPVVQKLATAVNAGRVLYNPQAAAACLAQGEQYATQHGPFWQWPEDGGLGFYFARPWAGCPEVLRGMVPPGGTCSYGVECAPQDGGVACTQALVDSCEARCTLLPPPGAEGEPCTGGCQAGLTCNGPTTDVPVCVRLRAAGASCLADGGRLPCEPGLSCLRGACRELPVQGEECEDACAAGFQCSMFNPRTCEAKPFQGEGAACSYDVQCERCLRCHPDPARDAGGYPWGTGSCRAPAALGESCAGRPCHLGLACVGGACVTRVRTGQPCSVVDGQDDAVWGSCALLEDACVGSPRVCTPRRTLTGCTSPAGPEATAGSCLPAPAQARGALADEAGTVCARPNAEATQGTCVPPAGLGMPCGKAFNVPAQCGEFLTCSAVLGGVGTCIFASGNQGALGAPCQSAWMPGWPESACRSGLFCQQGDAGVGTCAPASDLGTPCALDAQCTAGRCLLVEFIDAGTCHPWAEVGEECHSDWMCGPTRFCAGLEVGAGQCAPRVPAWAACTTQSQCGADDQCNQGRCVPFLCTAGWNGTYSDDSLRANLFLGALLTGMVLVGRRRWTRRSAPGA